MHNYLYGFRIHHTATLIEPPSFQELFSSGVPPQLSDLINIFLLPRIIIWDPLKQFSQYFDRCPNEECNGILEFHMWAIGENRATQPRLLHDTHYTVLLVGAVYKCASNNHIVFSTDARLIQKMSSVQLPFILLHRTGFTRPFIHSVVSLAKEGMPLQAIVRHIQTLREEFAAELLLKLTAHLICNGKTLTQSDTLSLTTSSAVTLITKPIPTNDIITRCVIIHFLENESFYKSEMLRMKVKHCLRLDHTFKVASNIGFLRPADGKWITQYGSVFLVLNHEGQVVTWQLTNSTSFDEVSSLLSNLKERIDLPEESPLTIYVDNCCHVRKKLQQIYGNNIIVKLDVFHAVQRVTRAMSKRHSLFYTCIHDLRMIFRYPTDICKKRTMNTPNTALILKNLDDFILKWKNAEHNDHHILTDKVMVQLQSLRIHMQRGCLSEIEPSGGTSQNEALHRHVNPNFSHAGRMGISLAYALLSILFYRCNMKKEKTSENLLTRLLTSKIGTASDCITVTPEFGIVGKDDGGMLNNNWLTGDCSFELTSDEGLAKISIHDIEHLLKKALSSADLAASMCLIIKNSPKFSYRMMPFMSSVPTLYFQSSKSTLSEHAEVHAKRLTNILESCSMCKHTIEGDGNCCFSAVAYSLISNLHLLTEPNKQFLQDLGVDLSVDMSTLAIQLRKVTVREWIENSSYYDGFLIDTCIEQEASKFLDPGYFYGDLADMMIPALSNALQTPIVVFSSIECHPFLCVTPETQKISVPLMVAFTQFGPGHYDGVIPKDRISEHAKSTKCSCGKNDRNGGTHCNAVKYKYTTICRCPCLKNNTACTELCKCKNCCNPHGRQESTGDTHKRKRSKHAWQKYKHMSSIEFAHSKLERVSTGPLTKVEFFLLENILSYCNSEEDTETTPESIHKIYETIVSSASQTDLGNIPLSHKTIQEIANFIDMRKKNLSNFEQLCKMQLEWNRQQEI